MFRARFTTLISYIDRNKQMETGYEDTDNHIWYDADGDAANGMQQ